MQGWFFPEDKRQNDENMKNFEVIHKERFCTWNKLNIYFGCGKNVILLVYKLVRIDFKIYQKFTLLLFLRANALFQMWSTCNISFILI